MSRYQLTAIQSEEKQQRNHFQFDQIQRDEQQGHKRKERTLTSGAEQS